MCFEESLLRDLLAAAVRTRRLAAPEAVAA
jgi:hypothetical protein